MYANHARAPTLRAQPSSTPPHPTSRMRNHHSLPGLDIASINTAAPIPFDAPPSLEERLNLRPDAASLLPLFLFGLFAALAAAAFLFQLLISPMHRWSIFFLTALLYTLPTVAAGTAGTSLLWSLLSEKPAFHLRSLLFTFSALWAFFPALVLFYRHDSAWILLATSLTAAITATTLRRLMAAPTPAFDTTPPPWQPSTPAIPTFSAISTAQPGRWRILIISITVQAALVLAILNSLHAACFLLCIPAALLAWQATSARITAAPQPPTQSWPTHLLAFALTLLALLPLLSGAPFLTVLARLFGTPTTPTHSAIHPVDATDYTSIILWPSTPKKKTTVVRTPHHALTPGSTTAITKPLVIPFDGPYWYFQPPDTRPSPHSVVMRGKSTVVNMHSTNDWPLEMEAHQTLAQPIPLDCCRAIDLDLTNADNRPGLIAISLILTDATTPHHASQQLALQPILSSEPAHFSLVRSPVNETLHFHIPPGQLRRFNEITVVFHTAQERSFGGAKVAIKQFTLIPR
ncbi:MAG: hypothetical protein WBY53_05370 [Acidobacteriaceae bacterium]